MSMTIGAASAANRVAEYLLGLAPAGRGTPTPHAARDAALDLIAHAYKTLSAGLTPEMLAEAWPADHDPVGGSQVAGHCPMGCGQTLRHRPNTGRIACTAGDCPRPLAITELLAAPPVTEHLINYDDVGWTIQHPLHERLDGSLMGCEATEIADGLPEDGYGTYRATYEPDEDVWDLELVGPPAAPETAR